MAGFASLRHRSRRTSTTKPDAAGTGTFSHFIEVGWVVRFVSVVALATAIALFPAFAQTPDEAASPSTEPVQQEDRAVEEPVQKEAGSELEQKREELIADAVAALDETEKALAALEEGESQKALDSLALATGKLELIIAREPELALAPVDVDLITLDVLHDVDDINAIREDIKEAVAAGEIQKARSIIRRFGSELIVATTNLPLGTYPVAIKLAAAMIDAGDVDGAKQSLQTAMSTLVVTETVIPLPIMRARLLLEKAEESLKNGAEPSKSADGKAAEDDVPADSETMEPADYIEAARKQLAMAEALGYGTADEHKELRKNLEELEAKVEGGEKTTTIFQTIAENIAKIRSRLLNDENGT
jgi:YfdX protein